MRSMLLLLVLMTLCFDSVGLPTERLPTERSPTDFSIPFDATEFRLTGRIVNGTKALMTQFLHQVSLIRSWSEEPFCNGVIISPSLVLTARHCMIVDPKRIISQNFSTMILEPKMFMVVGGNLDDHNGMRQQRSVKSIHPNFDNLYNDHLPFAILKLSEPFFFTPELHSVRLAGNTPEPNTVCQTFGWGYQSSNFSITHPDLMYVNRTIRGTDECRKLVKNVIGLPLGMFCAGYLEGGRDAYKGYSGNGMVCDGKWDSLTGILVYTDQYAELEVYADVSHYLDTILEESKKLVEIVEIVRVKVEKRSTEDTETGGNYGTSNTSSAMVIILSFFFRAVINCDI